MPASPASSTCSASPASPETPTRSTSSGPSTPPHGVATIYDYGDCHDCPPVCDRGPRVFTRWSGEIDAGEPEIEWHIGGHDPAPGPVGDRAARGGSEGITHEDRPRDRRARRRGVRGALRALHR